MNEKVIKEAIIFAVKRLQEDYRDNLLCHEWSLQSALYMHLRGKLKLESNEKIWCELRLRTEHIQEIEKETVINKEQVAVDMAIVTINNEEWFHLKNRIVEVNALIEIKYVQMSDNAKNQFMQKFSDEKDIWWAKIVKTLYGDIIKLNKLRWCCMNMNDENLLGKFIPSTYFITCIEDSKTYKEEFMIIENWKLIYSSLKESPSK